MSVEKAIGFARLDLLPGEVSFDDGWWEVSPLGGEGRCQVTTITI
jgi:hypothetical protein